MQAPGFNDKLRNLVIVALVIAVTLVSANHYKYLVTEKGLAATLHTTFWFVLLGGFCLLIWLAWTISTRRLISFVAVIFIIEYINQALATTLKLWTYTGEGGAYIFGIWAWVVSGLVTYAIASRAVVRLTMKGKLHLPRFLNPLIVTFLFFLICLFGRDYLVAVDRQAVLPILSFYSLLMVVGILASLWMDTRALVGVIISALIVGFISECSGATARIWQFSPLPTMLPSCPPVYLILGCWPLEILAQFALSALIAGEAVVSLPPSEEPPQGTSSGTGDLDDGGQEAVAGEKASGVPPQPSASDPPVRSTREIDDLPEDLTDEEKVLRVFLRISALVYFVVGLMFAIWPGMVMLIGSNPGDFIRSPTEFPRVLERFWVSMSFSMMMIISFLAFYAQYDLRKNKLFVIPLLIAKASSATSALIFFVFVWPARLHLAIFVVDGTLFWLTLYFFLRANIKFFRTQTAYFRDRLDSHPPSGKETTVAVFKGDDKWCLLDKVLVEASFYKTLEERFQEWQEKRKADGNSTYSEKDFSVVIKPNFMFAHSKLDPSTYTDPELVEHLAKRIREKGFTNIKIVESQSSLGNYYDKRTVKKMAEYLGYSATNYEVVDLTEEKVEYDYGGTLGPDYIGPTWKDAGFRISFAKNKTHIFSGYTLTLKNIYGTFPIQNKLKAYHTKREFDWPTIETLKPGNFPVHFGLIDAFISADGQLGVICDPEPNLTKTIIGGNNLVAVDQVGGKKMGLNPDDPSMDRCFYLAVKTLGRPNVKLVGDTSKDEKYEPWENVSQIFIKSLDLIEEAYRFSDWCFSILSAQDEIFPFKRKTPTVLFLRWLFRPLKRIYFKYDAL